MQWDKAAIDSDEVKVLAETYGLDLLAATIMVRRKILDPPAICYFLEDDLRFLHNSFSFKQMEVAVDRINTAIEGGEKVFVFGDRDVDGITSTALLVEILRELGGVVDWAVPTGDEAYGLSKSVVESAYKSGATLLITVDCGISNFEEIELAREKLIDTIVVDHHNPQGTTPDALALLNPKMIDGGYPFKDLAGCGVVFKLCWALLFSKTSYFGSTITLLNIRPINNSYVLEGVKLRNLVEIERFTETLVPGIITYEKSRTAEFLSGEDVCVYDLELQKDQLEKIFGNKVSVTLTDIMPALVDIYPRVAGQSLLKVRAKSRVARYSQPPLDELGMLISLATSLILKTENLLTEQVEQKLDLVALATLADIMPLSDENRIFVKRGMIRINSRTRPAIAELLFRAGLSGKTIGTREVAWNIAPIINSAGRMGQPDKAVRLLLTESQDERAELAAAIFGLNKLRKKKEEKIWDTVLADARKSLESCDDKFVYVSASFIDRGITGLLASRLVKTFNVPAVVIAQLKERAVGSMRSPHQYSIKEFLTQFEDLLVDFGGHDFAAGFTMSPERLPQFEERFFSVIKELETIQKEEEVIKIDAEVPPEYLTPDIWRIVEFFEPYGEANPPLRFLTRGLTISSVEYFGKKGPTHLKLLLETRQFKWPAILWNGAKRMEGKFSAGERIDVVYRVTRSAFQGQEVFQLIIQDIKR